MTQKIGSEPLCGVSGEVGIDVLRSPHLDRRHNLLPSEACRPRKYSNTGSRSASLRATGAGIDLHLDDAFGHRARLLWHAAQRFAHEVHPDGHRGARAFFAFAQRSGVVHADPDARDQAVIEAVEPGVDGQLVVPVLPRRSERPNASARRPVPRVMTSLIMSFMRKDTCGVMTRVARFRATRARGQAASGGTVVALTALLLARSASDTASTAAHSQRTHVCGSAVNTIWPPGPSMRSM